MINEALDGRRVAVTGATGFLGTALIERLLRCVPGCEVAAVVRPGRRAGAEERVQREIVRNDCFDRLRAELGDRFDAEIGRRLITVSGDIGLDGLGLGPAGAEVLAACDVVVHSAATVAFDAPLDSAVQVNLLGPARLAGVLAGLDRKGPLPHLVAVSTAYVAGTRRGAAEEALLADSAYVVDVDWRQEVAAAERLRGDVEAESRSPARLDGFTRSARRDLGAAGTPLLAGRAERHRQEWVSSRLVEAGRARSRALGWPDAYAYTKALGEMALGEAAGDLSVTIVRPSIIESALAEPRPGWIRGFRMAEPVILAYGRGQLSQFPGAPEGIIDVIPVDLVAAAIIAVAADGPGRSPVYQVASGARNPLRYGTLVELIQSWFDEHPLYDPSGQPVLVPDVRLPGRGQVQRQLTRALRLLGGAERLATAAPLRGRRAEVSGRLEDRRLLAERALGYVELYGAYAESEALYGVDRLLQLWEALPGDDRERFCFDPAVLDWKHYVREVHLPSVVAHARVRTTPTRRRGPTREDRGRRAVLSPERHMAVFDLENTLVASNVVESYAWLATRHLSGRERARLVGRVLADAPGLVRLDRRDRGDFLRSFYRRYAGAPAALVAEDAWEMWSDLLLLRAFPEGIHRVREHRAQGHRTLLITGALDIVVAPLGPLFDDVVCARVGTRDGRMTGELEASPPTGEARALALGAYASSHGLSLGESVAYADSTSDLPMLEAVGHPVAVNAEARLAAVARRRGWHVEHWTKAPGGPRAAYPIGPRA